MISHSQWEVDDEDCTIINVIQPRQIIGVGLKKVAKTSAERNREYRARKALLKKQSAQQQQQKRNSIDKISTEDIQGAGPSQLNVIAKRTKSAEATRRWREKKTGVSDSELFKKQAKTAAQRMREFRERNNLAKQILLKQQFEQQNSYSNLIYNASIRENLRAGPSEIRIYAERTRRGSEQTGSGLPNPRAERMREYRERRGTNIITESDNHSTNDDVYILLPHVREGGFAHCASEDGTNSITNPAAVALDDGDTSISGSCTWSSFEPCEGSFSITTTEESFHIRTINEPGQQSPDKSVVIKNEPLQDSWPFDEASDSSFVVKETFQHNSDFESLNEKAQSVKTELFDVRVERDEHLIFGEYIANRFRKCKRNDTEVNVAKNHIESILLELSTGAYSYINSIGRNQINRSDKAPSFLTHDRVAPVVQAIIVKEEIDL